MYIPLHIPDKVLLTNYVRLMSTSGVARHSQWGVRVEAERVRRRRRRQRDAVRHWEG